MNTVTTARLCIDQILARCGSQRYRHELSMQSVYAKISHYQPYMPSCTTATQTHASLSLTPCQPGPHARPQRGFQSHEHANTGTAITTCTYCHHHHHLHFKVFGANVGQQTINIKTVKSWKTVRHPHLLVSTNAPLSLTHLTLSCCRSISCTLYRSPARMPA